MRIGSVSVRASGVNRGETMESRKIRAIGVKGEHRAIAPTAAKIRRPIQGAPRQYQRGKRSNSVAVGARWVIPCCEIMQGRKARSIGFESEHRAITGAAATIRSPIQGVAG